MNRRVAWHLRQWAGYGSALVYRWTTVQAARHADADLFAFLADRLPGARVLDCGCGPGGLSQELARRGASHVLAVDCNKSMVRQARARLASERAIGTVEVLLRYVDYTFFDETAGSFNLVLFKRSLYASRPVAIATIRAAAASMAHPGVVVVIHPERSVSRYVFGKPPRVRGYSAYHLFNRLVSSFAAWLRVVEYRTYTGTELRELLADAVPDRRVVTVPTRQQAYNIAAVIIERVDSP